MSSKRGGRSSTVATNDGSSSKGKNASECLQKIEQLTHDVADVNLQSGEDDGEWVVYSRKSRNRAKRSAAKPWSPPVTWYDGGVGRASGYATGNPWESQNANFRRTAEGTARTQLNASKSESSNVISSPLIRPPLEHGWNWQSRTDSRQHRGDDNMVKDEITEESPVKNDGVDEEGEEGFGAMEDTDDDLMSDDYDSDTSQKSHETRKKSKWFKVFFKNFDNLPIDKINEPERQWHCPACRGGPGAIDWYRGLQPLITHAKTKGSKRVKIHREFAELLDEELLRRGTAVIPPGEVFGKWKGLKDEEKDHEIVWPPMVVIQNTRLEQDENDKWLGMGNQELLNYFSTYDAVKARHSYGPHGHRGLSVLIFEASAIGYLEAERLHKDFAEQGTDRNAWFSHHRRLFLPGGRRQLYGYMAVKEDLDIFNRHCQGKSRLKYNMRSYQEMVVNQLRQMNEDNQLLVYLKDRDVRKQKQTKALEESLDIVTEKLRRTMEENRIVRLRTKMQHEENKEEMYMQEQFFKEQIRIIQDSRAAKEEEFERMQQEKREKVKPLSSSPLDDRVDEYLKFVEFQDKEMENFVAEEEKLRKAHKENVAAMIKRHWEEKVQLEESFNEGLSKLMEKYSLSHQETKFNAI
ncbi:protein SUPPRESSOR OF GENE SILENCING 3 [Vigna radiata var. radiata]|uniref:Protein SUPPRESSOR OF GENE SILENCING 3 n=1 Tax=Vigna radiata var. radiata TaxID=3916 RepID=A0A1S3UHY3_VIGRR|nr:protein SUPPRESSOR OF GENE SILENCING 3 [Vigna radiata var. radiata]XP_014505555.1 protein SUPPRESSOR OF GENE SILENCING 3 [Vigna radiata var. radiata]